MAVQTYQAAQLTAAFVGTILGGKVPSLYDAFPGLFREEAEKDAVEQAKAQMMAYAQLWNDRRNK